MSKKALTPMMQQYLGVRENLPPNTLLLFRLGDFYEMFDEDALDQELADLEDENIDEMLTGGGNKMPSVPQTSLPQKQQVEDEEDEFAALEKEMNF